MAWGQRLQVVREAHCTPQWTWMEIEIYPFDAPMLCHMGWGGGWVDGQPSKTNFGIFGMSYLSAIWTPSNNFEFLKCWSVTKLKFDGYFCVEGVWNDGKLLSPCVCRVVSENMKFWTSLSLSLVICMMMLTIFALKNFLRGWTKWRTLLTTCATCKTPILVSLVGVCIWNLYS